METKKCTVCKKVKTLISFNKNKNHKDGHAYECRKCGNEKRIERRKHLDASGIAKEAWSGAK